MKFFLADLPFRELSRKWIKFAKLAKINQLKLTLLSELAKQVFSDFQYVQLESRLSKDMSVLTL